MNIKLLQFVMPAGAPCLFAPNTHILLCQAYVREKPSVAERRTHTEVHPIVAPASSGLGLEGYAATLHTYNTLQTSEVRKPRNLSAGSPTPEPLDSLPLESPHCPLQSTATRRKCL